MATPEPRPLRETLARNTLFNALGRVWELVLGLVLVRVTVDAIGVEGFGLWEIAAPVTAYVALLDLGISSSFVKYIAEHAGRDEDDELSAVVSSGFFYYLIFGAGIMLLAWPLIGRSGLFLQTHFEAPPESMDDLVFLVRGCLILFFASNCVGAFTAVQTGLQHMGVTNLLGFAASLVKFGVSVALLAAGHGVRALLYGNAAAFVLFAVLTILAAFRLRPTLRCSPRRARWSAFRRLFAFGWRAQVARLSNLVMFETDRLIVAVFERSLGMVGVYAVGVGLANKMRQAPVVMVSALLPAASDLDARADDARLRRMYLLSTKYQAAVAVPLVLLVAGSAGPLIHAWMGRPIPVAEWVLRIIALGYIANILPGAGVSIALGKGRADLQMWAGLLSMSTNLALTILLVLTIGFWGIPIATAISMFVSWAWFAHAMKRLTGVGMAQLLRVAVAWPVLASLPGFAACILLDFATQTQSSALVQAGIALLSAAVFAASYLLAIRVMPFLDAFDLDFLEETLRLKRLPGFQWWTRSMRRA